MLRCCCLALAAALAAAPAAGAREKDNKFPDGALKVLEKADSYELLSLDPGTEGVKDGFHGWKVLGKTTVKDKKARALVLGALKKGVAERGRPWKCFEPRHGPRATHGGTTVELVICFECGQVVVHVGKAESKVWTSPSPEPTLDKVPKDAGVKLAPKP